MRVTYNGEVETWVQYDKEPACFKVKEHRKCLCRDTLNKTVIRALKATDHTKVCKKKTKEQSSVVQMMLTPSFTVCKFCLMRFIPL